MRLRIAAVGLLVGGVLAAFTLLAPVPVKPSATEVSASVKATQTAYPTPLNYWYGMTQIAKAATTAAEIRPTEKALGR